MARHCRGQRPRTERGRKGAMGRILTQSRQTFLAAFVLRMFRIDVIVIGRKYGVLTGTNGVMDRIVSAAATQTSQGAMPFAAVPIVRVSAAEWPLRAAHPRQEQAGENDAHEQFGD